MSLTPFNGYLYAGTWVEDPGVHGAEIWRSNTGNNGSWTRVVSNGFDNDNDNNAILSMKVFDGALYAATGHQSTGGEVWRTSDGGQLVPGQHWRLRQRRQSTWCRWRSSAASCTPARGIPPPAARSGARRTVRPGNACLQGGFGNVDNRQIAALIAFRGEFFVLAGNFVTGPEVWRSSTGDFGSWRKVIDGALEADGQH